MSFSWLNAGSQVLGQSGLGRSDNIGPALSRATLRDNTFVTGSFDLNGGSAAIGTAAAARGGGMPGASALHYALVAGAVLVGVAFIARGRK